MIVTAKGRLVFLGVVALVVIGILLAALLTGLRPVSWGALLSGRSAGVDAEVVWHIRLPRLCLGFLSGAVLAVSGMAFQALFRNPLATPYTLGVSSGAAVGAALYMKSGLSVSLLGVSGLSITAFLAAAGTMGLVYGLTRAGRGFSTPTLLLAGVAISFFFSSVVLFIQYVGDVTTSFRVGRWLMGGLEVVGFRPVWQLLPFATIGLMTVVSVTRELDLFAIGEDIAAARGVSVARFKKILFLAASVMVGGVVAVCGPIGFVGLIVPHVGRLVIGPQHKYLTAFCLMAGGAFLVLCDTVGRSVIAPIEVPVGIITALMGGPFFLGLLLQGRSDRDESEV